MQGYRSVRPVSDEELTRIPLLYLIMNLRMDTEMGIIVTEGIAADDPEWTVKLRQKLAVMQAKYHQQLESFTR